MRIVFATDGSDGAEVARDLLLSLPLRASDAIVVLAVIQDRYYGLVAEGYGLLVAEAAEEDRERARQTALAVSRRFTERGIRASEAVAEGPTVRAIIDAAVRAAADLIVVGSRGRGLVLGSLLGSTARDLARHSPLPVLVVRDRREAPCRVLVAVDGSDDSTAALETLAALPLPACSALTLLHVAPELAADVPAASLREGVAQALAAQQESDARRMLERAGAALSDPAGAEMVIERGDPAPRILALAAASDADLIVLGSRGLAARGGFLQGSTADRVLSSAHCGVLVARTGVRARLPEPAQGRTPALAGAK